MTESCTPLLSLQAQEPCASFLEPVVTIKEENNEIEEECLELIVPVKKELVEPLEGGAFFNDFVLQESGENCARNIFCCSKCDFIGTKRREIKEHLIFHDEYYSTEQSEVNRKLWVRKYKTSKYCLRTLQNFKRRCKEKTWFCDKCGYSPRWAHELKAHVMSVHTGEKPFKYEICDYRAARSGDIRKHFTARHADQKPFGCRFCSHRSVRQTLLNEHIMAKHNKEKLFACPYCTYRTIRQMDLRIHIVGKHSSDQPFQCSQCDYTTARKVNLQRHVMAHHTNERPFLDILQYVLEMSVHVLRMSTRGNVASSVLSVNSQHYALAN